VREADYRILEEALREIGDSSSGPEATYADLEGRGDYWKKETIRLRLLARNALKSS
jgi:hypothetical protein